jgi:hypothetical protein
MRPARITPLVVFLGLSLGVLAGAALTLDIACAASGETKGLELLSRASRSYEAGAYTDAAEQIDAAFKAGLTGEGAARGILLRAEINERSGALARALQDYSNALWMESLPPSDKVTAREGKERVMAAMGLSAPPPSGSVLPTSAPSGASPPPPVQGNSSGGVLGFFSGIFGSDEKKPEPPPPPQPQESWQVATSGAGSISATPPQKPSAQKPPKPVAPVKVAKATKPAPTPVSIEPRATLQPASAVSLASSADGFLIVFGSVNNEVSGRSTAQQIKAQLADILVNRQIDVALKPGRGYQIQAGPYKTKSAALALCSAMKQRGVPCQVTP